MAALAHQNVYLKDLVAKCLAERGLPGSVEIRPHKPLAARLESGERARFVIEYEGVGSARVVVDEYQIAGGTIGASVATSLADLLARDPKRSVAPWSTTNVTGLLEQDLSGPRRGNGRSAIGSL